ncbi:MAG: hypothetical protein KatS3mg022_2770 [Armatimonadota bacterium]|nr:MAG: hypothetical protein KatS3mg022_2770 [Armatimonadota bacterium]
MKLAVRGMQLVNLLLLVLLLAWVAAVVLNGTALTDIINVQSVYLAASLLVTSEGVDQVVWWLVHAVLVISAIVATFISLSRQVAASRAFLSGVIGLACLYLIDPLLSTREPFLFSLTVWSLQVTLIFFGFAWVATSASTRVLIVDFLLFCIALQAGHAIVYHIAGINQFSTPGFGHRTQGTYLNPNVLYPVLVIGAALAYARSLTESIPSVRWIHVTVAALCLVATWMTYTRGAWLAVAAICLAALLCPRKPLVPIARTLIFLTALLFLVGALLVRTKGRLMANPDDRPAWGRVAIWKTAVSIWSQHPWIGHGLMSYPQWQDRRMSSELLEFGPRNYDAKNLFLNLAVEFGLIGVAIFVLTIWAFYRLSGYLLAQPIPETDTAILYGSRLGGLGILVAGLFDTPILEGFRFPSSVVLSTVLGVATACSQQLCVDRLSVLYHFLRWLATGVLIFVSVAVAFWLSVSSHVKPFAAALQESKLSSLPLSTTLADVTPHFLECLIASEDGNFYQHHGVDWQALHRALRVNIRSLSYKQGGSTITMQTARYLFVGREKSLSRKLAEILLALEMEKRLSKERILELYLNSARFGLGAEDIGTACRVYFGKRPKELTLAESAFLAGVLPEPPSRWEELTLEKVERCKRRALSRLGYFFGWRYSPEQIEQAMREKIVFVWER